MVLLWVGGSLEMQYSPMIFFSAETGSGNEILEFLRVCRDLKDHI